MFDLADPVQMKEDSDYFEGSGKVLERGFLSLVGDEGG